jgi:hypothetical protein
LKELRRAGGVYKATYKAMRRLRAICYDRILHYDSKVTQSLKLPIACLLLVLGAFVSSASAQQTETPAYQPFSPAPYRVGERLTYNVSFSNFIAAAHVELFVAARGTFFGREGIQLNGHVASNGVVSAALFAVNNNYTAYIDPATGQPFHVEQTIRQNSRTERTMTDFSQPAGNDVAPSKSYFGLPGAYDFVSAVYRLRALPLTDGSTYTVAVKDENQNYRVDVRITGRETINTSAGSFGALVSQVRIKNEADGDSYSLKVHFSDDQRHIPLLITTRVSTGQLQIELAGSTFVTPVATPTPTPTPSPGTQPPKPPVAIPATPAANDSDTRDLPFKVGEQLNYRVFLPNINSPVATATFQVRARSKYFDHDGFMFTLNAQTTNALQKLFVASDTMSSYVDPKTLLPFHTEFAFSEGRHRFANKLTINQEYGTVTTDKGERIEIPIGTHDYLSYFYLVRTFNMAPGKRNAISILVDNKPKTLFIAAVKIEDVQIGTETIPAILVALTTDDPQPDKFQLRGWISNDKRRLPLRFTAMTELGLVRADLDIIPLVSQ